MYRILYAIPGALSKTDLGAAEVNRRSKILQSWAAPDVQAEARDVPRGPASIESAYEEYLSVPPTAELLASAEQDGFSAAVLGCFGDPGLDALREITTTLPIVGPGEAAFHLASMLGDRFGIVTVTDGVVGPLRHLVARSGLAGRLAGIAVTGIPVLELTGDRDAALEAARERGRELLDAGADVLVLGCMSMAFLDVTQTLEHDLGVPVVNPARAALHTAEMIARSGLMHSKRAFPTPAKLASGQVRELAALLL
jgi:allantoin racemase